MEDNSTIMLLQILASFKSEEELVQDAIVDLVKYKESGCSKEKPLASLTLCFLKWGQGGDPLEKVMKDTQENLELFNQLKK